MGEIEFHPLRAGSLQTDKPEGILHSTPPHKLTDATATIRRKAITSEITEEDPLVSSQHTNPLISYTQRYIIEDQQVEDSQCARRLRIGAKIIAALYGSTGGVPYIEVTCKAGQGILVFCVAFASGNVIASGAAAIWAALRIAQAFDPISEEEKKILHSSKSKNVLKHVACNLFGIIASIPGTYQIYKYNQQKLLAIPGFLYNYMPSTVGYYELANPSSLFQKFLSKFRRKDAVVREAEEFKENFSKQIDEHVVPTIVSNSKVRRKLFMDAIEADDKFIVSLGDEDQFQDAPEADDKFIVSLGDEDQLQDAPKADDNIILSATNQQHKEDAAILDDTTKVKKFMKKVTSITSEKNTSEPPEEWKGGCPRTTTQILSMIFPTANVIVNYLLNYELSLLFSDSPFLCHPLAIITTLPILMVDVLANYETSSAVFDAIYNKVRKRDRATFMSTYYSTLNVIIPIISVTLTCLSVTGAWVIARDAVQNSFFNAYGMVYILPVLALIDIAISQSFQMRDVLHDAVHYVSTFRKGTVAETVKKVNKLDKLKSTISNADPAILYDFKAKMKDSRTDHEGSLLQENVKLDESTVSLATQ
ncbi:MAG: hypothetical protein FJX71_00985 [Alphaproteobacteria bacterium]|nr:hypothetical protein [Alphaproteobacteria bacterium]